MFHRCLGRLHAAAFTLLAPAADRAGAFAARARDPRGQGTVEYVALILLVAVVLAGVVAATRKTSIGDGQIAKTIVKKLHDALKSVK